MATDVTIDSRTDGFKTAPTATSLAWNHTITAGMTNPWFKANGTSGTGTAVSPTSVQWDALGGSPQSLLSRGTVTETNNNCKAYSYGISPSITGTKQVKITFGASVEITGGSASYQFVNQTTPYNAASPQTATTATGTTATLNVTSATHEMGIACSVENGGTALTSTGAGQTVIHNENIGAGQHAGISADCAGAATIAFAFGGYTAGNTRATVGMSLQFDGGGGGGSTVVERRTFGSVGRVGTRRAA